MDRKFVEAVDLLATFKHDDPVRVKEHTNDEPRDMWISRTIHRADGKFGSYESSRVTVTYGPGRYATKITAEMMVHLGATIEKRTEDGEAEPQKGLLVDVAGERHYEVLSVSSDGKSCQVWHHGPILTASKRADGHWYFNDRRVRFHNPKPDIVDEILDLLKPVDETRCFCGEGINYDKPGDEGGEFVVNDRFLRSYPDHTFGESVIGHAQCGLDYGMEPA